jgi:hypothetical protein
VPQIILWALGTGFVTGVVWFAIAIYRRPQIPAREPPALPESQQAEIYWLWRVRVRRSLRGIVGLSVPEAALRVHT